MRSTFESTQKQRGKSPAERLAWKFLRLPELVFAATVFFFFAGAQPISANEETRADFLFKLHTALKTRDYPGLANCFELEGTEVETQRMLWKLLDQLVKWPSHEVKVTERSRSGPFTMEKNGRSYTLNGDWTFQIHIQRGAPPSRTFVFPAGVGRSGKYAILMSVPVTKN